MQALAYLTYLVQHSNLGLGHDFRERAAIFDDAVRGAPSLPHISTALGFATRDNTQVRTSNAAQGNTQDMEASSANL